MNVAHVNLNTLINKLNYVIPFLFHSNIHVLGISETWLNSDIHDAALMIPGFSILRADSPSGIKKHGVAVYIREYINYIKIDVCVSNVIVVYLCSYDLYIVTIYRPPSFSLIENNALKNFIIDFCEDKEVVLQGDLNLPSIQWDKEDVIASSYVLPLDLDFFRCLLV